MNLEDVIKPNLYSSKEVMEFMGIKYMKFYRLIRDGKLKAYNVSSKPGKQTFRFRAEDVQEYYDSLPHSSHRLEDVNK